MLNFVNVFKQLEATNSTKDKQAILEANKHDEQLKQLLLYNLNPYFNFYIKKMPDRLAWKDDPSWSDSNRYDCFISLLNDLKGRHTTGNQAKDTVQAVFGMFNDDYYNLYSKILLKGPIAVGTATVNKVWPNLIPEFKVMLAPSQLPELTQLQYPLYVQPKYDGFRVIYKEGIFYTRSGLVYSNINLTSYFDCLQGINSYVLDGEFYAHGKQFQDLSKVLNADDVPIPNDLKFYVYDCVPLADWNKQKTNRTYTDRLKDLRSLVNDTICNYKKVIDTPTDKVQSAAEVVEIYKKYRDDGYEGCMLKAVEGKYAWKRVTIKSGEMVKLKPFETLDLEIIDVIEGEGKYQGTLGSLVVSGGNIAPTSVGSGFTDADRKEIWRNKDKYVGKTAEVKYFEISEDKVLRFPIFERIREDK